MSFFRALSAPVVISVGEFQLVLPKIKMKHLAEVAAVLAKIDQSRIKSEIPVGEIQNRMLGAATADTIAINIDSLIRRCSTEAGARAVLEVTDKRCRDEGRMMIPPKMREEMIKGVAEAKADEKGLEGEARIPFIEAEVKRLSVLGSVDLMIETFDMNFICDLAYSIVIPNAAPKKKDEKANPPQGEQSPSNTA